MPESFEFGTRKAKECQEGISPLLDWRSCFDDGLKHPRPGQKGDPYLGLEPWMIKDRQSDQTADDRGSEQTAPRKLHRPKTFDPPAGAPGETYTVKPGDNLWTIAALALKTRNGSRPSNREIAVTVKSMAEVMGEKDPNAVLLLAGDKIFVPSQAVESSTGDKSGSKPDAADQLPVVEITEADHDAEKVRSAVIKNEQGEVATVTYPDGSSRDFEYSGNDATRIVYRSAPDKVYDVWELGSDGKWHRFAPDAKGQLQATSDVWVGKVTVDQGNGNLTYERDLEHDDAKHSMDPDRVIERPDGTKTEVYNPYSLSKNAAGQVTEVTDHSGKVTKIEYEGDGVKQIYAPDGKAMLDGFEKSVKVGENGDIVIEHADGSREVKYGAGHSTVDRSGGVREYHNLDGSMTLATVTADGRITFTQHTSAHGRQFAIERETAVSNSARYTIKPGDALEEIAEDALRQSLLYASAPGPIDPEIVKMAAEYLARVNGIVSPDLLVTGSEITIPANLWTDSHVVE
jgi:LysM repeat protein